MHRLPRGGRILAPGWRRLALGLAAQIAMVAALISLACGGDSAGEGPTVVAMTGLWLDSSWAKQ